MQRMNLLALVLLVLVFASCKKDSQSHFSPTTEKEGFVSSDQIKLEFAKALSKAMEEPGVRTLLKAEALKKFDNDYDVLFELVKNKEVKPGITFLQYLNSLASSNEAFSNLGEEAPLLTILVPELHKFSAGTWNANEEMPVVVVIENSFEEKKHAPLTAFDHTGNQLTLASNKEPDMPVIVVKENDRVVGVDASTKNARAVSRNLVFNNSSASFYFMDDSFKGNTGTQVQTESTLVGEGFVDPRMQQAFNLNAASQRDYLYYNILNPADQGTLDFSYGEYLTAFAVDNKDGLNTIYDDPTTDWADGGMEFQMDIMMFNGSSGLNKLTKVFSIARKDLISSDSVMSWYRFPSPILIATWDMKAMGDQWTYSVTELDPGTVTTRTENVTTKFAANFKLDLKIGLGFGGSAETSSTSQVVIQVTTGSDPCGSAWANFVTPIVTGKTTIGFPAKTSYLINELNTGTVSFIVIPKKIL